MKSRERLAESMIQRIRAMVPTGMSATNFLTELVDEALDVQADGPTPMGIVAGVTKSAVLASARKTAENVDSVARICARPEGIVDLGTIEWLMRPSVPLVDGAFSPIGHGPWRGLGEKFATTVACNVCRIEASTSGFGSFHLGTAFVLGQDNASRTVLVTNAHVVEAAQLKFGWPRIKESVLKADFGREIGGRNGVSLAIDSEFRIHPIHDLALVFVSECDRSTWPTMFFANSAPPAVNEKGIGVIGHPSFDSNLDPLPRIYGFGDAFGIKRFSPGLLRAVEHRSWRFHDVPVALHDATTLSGSSGSCVFDLETLAVLGLHFGGWPQDAKVASISGQITLAELFEANGAVPFWELVQDPFLEGIQIRWS